MARKQEKFYLIQNKKNTIRYKTEYATVFNPTVLYIIKLKLLCIAQKKKKTKKRKGRTLN